MSDGFIPVESTKRSKNAAIAEPTALVKVAGTGYIGSSAILLQSTQITLNPPMSTYANNIILLLFVEIKENIVLVF